MGGRPVVATQEAHMRVIGDGGTEELGEEVGDASGGGDGEGSWIGVGACFFFQIALVIGRKRGSKGGGTSFLLLRLTDEHEVIYPCIYLVSNETLVERDLLRCGVVGDTQVRCPLCQAVEGKGGVGFQPGDCEGSAAGCADMIVDEGIGQRLEETRLTSPASGNTEADLVG